MPSGSGAQGSACPDQLIPEGGTSKACCFLQAFDPFELLVQPGPSANFNYSWASYASVRTSNDTQNMVMSIDSLVPCCIPVNLTGAPPSAYSKATGRRLGLCDLSTNRATYSLNWDVYNVDLTNLTRASQVQALIKRPTPASRAEAPAPATKGEGRIKSFCALVSLFSIYVYRHFKRPLENALSSSLFWTLAMGLQDSAHSVVKPPGSKAVTKIIANCSLHLCLVIQLDASCLMYRTHTCPSQVHLAGCCCQE